MEGMEVPWKVYCSFPQLPPNRIKTNLSGWTLSHYLKKKKEKVKERKKRKELQNISEKKTFPLMSTP